MSCILSTFAGDTVAVARAAIDDTTPSDQATYRFHAALRALLLTYLPPRAAADWRRLFSSFDWPDTFAAGWTEAMRLCGLLCAISVLTEHTPNHVRRVAAPSLSVLLHILEDAGQPWLVAALLSSASANITTRAEMKVILTVNDPGGNVPLGGLKALRQSREFACRKCGTVGHLARNCPSVGLGPDQPSPAPINSLVQDGALISLLQRQERVQEKLLEPQERLAQKDASVAATGLTNEGTSMAQMAAPSTPRAPLIIEGAQPDGCIYVGLQHGLSVRGHADVVAASVTEPGGESGSI